jgi:signal transduction histidine kinase
LATPQALIGQLPTAPLFVQLLVLILLSLAATLVINILVVVNLPPPAPDIYRLSEVVRVMKGGQIRPSGDHRDLVVHDVTTPPPPEEIAGPRLVLLRRDIGQLLNVSPDDVVIGAQPSRFTDRWAYRLARERLAKDGVPSTEQVLISPFKVAVRQTSGLWRVVEPAPSLTPTPWQLRIMLALLLSVVVLAPLVYLYARRLAAPLAIFANAAERLGRDPGAPPLAIKGPAEIGVAVRAFNDMQQRLARYVDDRTAMVGAIAHDLRTPLTRLRFRLESAPDGLKDAMAADMAEMEAMISGTMAFVRDTTQPAARTKLELSSLVESVADDLNAMGADLVVESSDKVVIEGDPLALRRLLNNLMENAVKFAGGARARVIADADFVTVEIEDDGPGLPQRELERVFEPFHRHETSRSRNTGGIGLGLAVVRSISRAHGGDTTLKTRASGGLTASVRLPR